MDLKKKVSSIIVAGTLLVSLTACGSSYSNRPRVGIYPATNVSAQKFNEDNARCRAHADYMAGSRSDRNLEAGAKTGLAAAAAAAAAGGLIGRDWRSAGIGAGLGFIAGILGGAAKEDSDYQQTYNANYAACMQAAGHIIVH